MTRGGAVILAAGTSTRFGSDKRNHLLTRGRTMLQTTLATYQEAFDQVFVVLRPEDEPRASLLANVQPVYAPDAALGMGHSLAAGVRAAGHLEFLFVALADMPYLRAATLHRLIGAMSGGKSIVQPRYGDTPGHPVGFSRAWFGELKRLTGDTGARGLIAAHPGCITRMEVEDPGVVRDVDVPP